MTTFDQLRRGTQMDDGEPRNPKMDPLGPSGRIPDAMQAEQAPLDLIDEASMESFPCSDPPCYSRSHA